jgi:hypothetical protein
VGKVLWSDVAPNDLVELNGREWTVTKVKAKKKVVRVTVTDGKREVASEVPASGRVKRTGRKPLRAADNSQARWATDAEHRKTLPPGNPEVTKRPEKPIGDPWETPRDRVERKLDTILGAVLVGEGDPDEGFYVPPVDSSTIAAHLALFHGPEPLPATYDAMVEVHELQHEAALHGVPLHVNHWHTKTRPAKA